MADVTLLTSEEIRDKLKKLAIDKKQTLRDLTDEVLSRFLDGGELPFAEKE